MKMEYNVNGKKLVWDHDKSNINIDARKPYCASTS